MNTAGSQLSAAHTPGHQAAPMAFSHAQVIALLGRAEVPAQPGGSSVTMPEKGGLSGRGLKCGVRTQDMPAITEQTPTAGVIC